LKNGVSIDAIIEVEGFKLSVVEAFPVAVDVFQNNVLTEKVRVWLKPLEPDRIYGAVGFFAEVAVPQTYELSTFLKEVEKAASKEVNSILKEGRKKRRQSEQRKRSDDRKETIRERLRQMVER